MIENEPTEKKSGVTAIVIGIVVLLCCICVLVVGMGGYGLYAFSQVAPTPDIFIPTTPSIEEDTHNRLSVGTLPPTGRYDLNRNRSSTG